ncbi:MAG: DegT/DnrJ/EryC1/StrS family aminotransferase, partial [Armatimonadota bacterium]|nr:DegT/DnrJ/EryC1/StrS family aminotransferase [Armatimonadota bacterium]
EMDPILEIARSRGIPVVEDCAQAHGARYKGRLVGSIGDVGAFSTMSGKHHATAAQGGVVFTRNEEIYWEARRSSDRGKPFGLANASSNVQAALNLNLNDLAAVVGSVQLKKLNGIVEARRRVAKAIADGLRRSSEVVSPGWVPEGAEPSYWFYRLHVDESRITVDGNTFARAIAAEGIPVNPTYRAALQAHATWLVEQRAFGTGHYPWSAPEYKGDRHRRFAVPNAVAVLDSDFNLSIHERWGDEEVADTLAAIAKVEKAYLKR